MNLLAHIIAWGFLGMLGLVLAGMLLWVVVEERELFLLLALMILLAAAVYGALVVTGVGP